MLEVTERKSEGWLRVEDIDNFPCEDLRTINQLWLHYSDGQFGFSVQKEIYESLGGTREYNSQVWNSFGDHIGWRKGESCLNYNELTFNLDSAPKAHLPRTTKLPWHLLRTFRHNINDLLERAEQSPTHVEYMELRRSSADDGDSIMRRASLAQRLITCKI